MAHGLYVRMPWHRNLSRPLGVHDMRNPEAKVRLNCPEVYADLLNWTMQWYHECVEKVMPDTKNEAARHAWVVGAGKALGALHKKYGM